MDQEKSPNSTFSDSWTSEEAMRLASCSMADDAVTGGGDAHQSDENGGDGSKKAIWNKPSGVVTKEVGDVMGAESWPALSESAHSKRKSFSTNSLKTLSHGPPNVSQGMAVDLQKEVTGSIYVPNPASSPKHTGPTRQKSVKHGGGGGSSSHGIKQANGSLSQAPPTQGAVAEASPSNPGKSSAFVGESSRNNGHKDAGKRGAPYGGNGMLSQAPLTEVVSLGKHVASIEESSRDNENRDVELKGGSYDGNVILSQAPPTPNTGKSVSSIGEFSRTNSHRDVGQRGGSYGGNEQRVPFKRSNSGPLYRGDGSYHHSYGSNRRDHDRRNQNWNMHNRSFGSRGSHEPQQQREGSRPFLQVPSPNAPYISASQAPVPLQPFINPMVYTGVPQPLFVMPGPSGDHIRPFVPVPYHPIMIPMSDPDLPSRIVRQIDYYFSEENLVRDWYLKTLMDKEGWVPIQTIAGFFKVKQLTQDIQLILYCLQASTVVEVQADKVRLRNDWPRWIQGSVRSSTSSEQLSGVTLDGRTATNRSTLTEQLSGLTLDERMAPNRSTLTEQWSGVTVDGRTAT